MSTSSNSFESTESLPPQLSERARSAVSTYIHEAGGHASPDTTARAIRVIGTLAAFAPDDFPQTAFDAAAMQPLARHLRHPDQHSRYRAAGMGLLDYFSEPESGRKSSNYVGTLLGDLRYIDKAADSYMDRLRKNDMHSLLKSDEGIPKDAWLSLRVGANVPVLAEVCGKTNVESQLAAAAFVADLVFHPQDEDRKLFRDVLRTETFDAPLLEIYGLHAFDMMMQSNAGKVRVMKSGNEAVLEHTMKVLDEAKKISVEDIMKQVFGHVPKEHLFQTSQESLYDEKIVFSSTALSEVCDESEGKLNARFKSVGKYALKLLRNANYDLESETKPADIFGMLAVLPDRKALGNLFGATVEQLLTNNSVDFVVSASKRKPLYIQGSPEYVREICMQLPPEVLSLIQLKVIKNTPEDHIYQVTKFTCEINFAGQKLPMEFQFQTSADRTNARLGPTSHMNHNAGHDDDLAAIIPGSPSDLRTIFTRAKKIDGYGETVNGQSIRHGEELQRALLKSLDY